jgi:hypothetical protein
MRGVCMATVQHEREVQKLQNCTRLVVVVVVVVLFSKESIAAEHGEWPRLNVGLIMS